VCVLRLVAAERRNREIAEALFVSERTVERHLENAYRKVGARNRADAAAYATALAPSVDISPDAAVPRTGLSWCLPGASCGQRARHTLPRRTPGTIRPALRTR
jgi:hypothetical protein